MVHCGNRSTLADSSMIRDLLNRKLQGFTTWWQAPTTRKDRVTGALVGAFGCFWIGVLGRLIFGATPVSFEVLVWWAIGSVVIGIVLGLFFPKATACVCFPFAMFG